MNNREPYRNVELVIRSPRRPEYDGRYSLYETVDVNAGNPITLAEDGVKSLRTTAIGEEREQAMAAMDYFDKLVRLPAPDEDEIDADIEDVTYYFTPEGWDEYIESEQTLEEYFQLALTGGPQPIAESVRADVTETNEPGALVYRDDIQIAALDKTA
jgi:hypothetical protein